MNGPSLFTRAIESLRSEYKTGGRPLGCLAAQEVNMAYPWDAVQGADVLTEELATMNDIIERRDAAWRDSILDAVPAATYRAVAAGLEMLEESDEMRRRILGKMLSIRLNDEQQTGNDPTT